LGRDSEVCGRYQQLNKMIRLIYIVSILILIGCHTEIPTEHTYIDEIKPSTTPLIFAKEFISNNSISDFGSIFNKDNDEFYFAIDTLNRACIKYAKYQEGNWTTPVVILSDSTYSFNDPFLSNDEQKLYYISNMPRNEQDTIEDYDIWYSKKEGEKWSRPINAGMAINSDANEYYISFAQNGAMYFSSNKGKDDDKQYDFDIYKSEYKGGEFETPQRLSDSINSKRYEADVFISPDESYIIYSTARRGGIGRRDLNISFKDENDHWANSINMGEPINTKANELCPFVTKDGKYLFYTSNQDIYWVSAEVINELKGDLTE